MGAKEADPVVQTNSVQLSPEAQRIERLAFPFLNQYAKADLNLPQPQIAGFNPNEVAGQNAALAAAGGPMSDQVNQAAATNSFLMNTALQDPSANPWLGAAAGVIRDQATRNLNENVLPGLRSGSTVSGGMYGGGATRLGVAQAGAVGNTARASDEAITQLYNDAWKTGLATSGAAVDRSGQISKNLLMPATTMAGVGAQQREMEQANLDANSQYAWMQQQLPYLRAMQLYDVLGKMPGSTGVSTVTPSQPQSGGLGGAAGGALSGAASGAAIGSIIPGIGTAIGGIGGGILGGLGGWFS